MNLSSNFKLQIKSYLETGNCRGITKLLENGLHPNFVLDELKRLTLLHFAVGFHSFEQYELVKSLLSFKADPNRKSSKDLTPVHLSVIWNRHKILDLLVRNGGNMSLKNSDGKSSLDIARDQNSEKCLKVLFFHLSLQSESSICSFQKMKLNISDNNSLGQITDSFSSFENETINSTDIDSFLSCLNTGFCDITEFESFIDIANVAMIDPAPQLSILDSKLEVNSSTKTGSYTTAREDSLMLSYFHRIFALQTLSNSEIFTELKNLGENPGPITNDVRNIYLKKLSRLRTEKQVNNSMDELSGFPNELKLVLTNRIDVNAMQSMDHDLSSDFARPDPKKKWRQGTKKICFNYLLLDPRITKRLSSRAASIPFNEQFVIFVKSVFYIGKGQNNRPLEHLLDALKAIQNKKDKNNPNKKITRILNIWEAKLGVVCVRCFQNAIPTEAFTREACMIDSLGLENITNEKRGEFYGSALKWSTNMRRIYGAYLIKRALQLYINDGERQIQPQDLKMKF